MRLRYFFTVGLLLFVKCSFSQVANWAFATGGSFNESSIYDMSKVHRDNNGNVYQGGVFGSASIDVDPSSAVVNLINSGGNDGYVAKYSSSGNLIWAIKIGGSANDGVHNVATDNIGNVYVTGYFAGTVDFDPSPGTYNLTAVSTGQSVTGDVFVAKYSSSGQLLWAFGFGGGTGYDYGNALAVAPDGTFYIGGIVTMLGNLDIDPSGGVYNLNIANGNAFCAKYNTNGQLIAGFNIGGAYENSCVRDIILDNNGEMYLGGYLKGNCDIDPSSGVKNVISNSEDPFVIKMDTSFNFLWGFNISNSFSVDEGFSLSLDENNIYFSGYIGGSNIDFDPSPANTSLAAMGGSDNFIASYTKSGQYRWAHVIGALGNEWAVANARIGSDVLVCGSFRNTVDFDPSPLTAFILISHGGTDGYCLRLDSNGVFKCAFQIGSALDDYVRSIVPYGPDKMYINGSFHNLVHIPEPSGTPLTSNGSFDIFMADIDWECAQCINTMDYSVNESKVGCQNLQFSAINNGTAAAVTFFWDFGDGSTSGLQNPTHLFQTFGVYNVLLVTFDSSGCVDSTLKQISIEALDYTIHDSLTDCKTVSLLGVPNNGNAAGVQFKWFFGDGAAGVGNPISYSYSASGSYPVTLIIIDSLGCLDSAQTLINIAPDSGFTLVPSQATLCLDDSVRLSASGGDSYLWYPPINISDPTSATPVVYPDTSITYHVVITRNACFLQDTLTAAITLVPKPEVTVSKSNDIDCGHDKTTLSANGGFKYQWLPAPGLTNLNTGNPIAAPSVTTTFTVIGESLYGCKDTAAITVEVKNEGGGTFFIPNAFTPDNNSINDCWHIGSNIELTSYNLYIYNRWGNLLFEAKSPDECWNGFYRGEEQPAGTFFYFYKASSVGCGDFSGKGDFLLLR